MSDVNNTNTEKWLFALKRLSQVELIANGTFNSNTICGYSRHDIKEFLHKPHIYSHHFIHMIRHMYLHSGYFKRIIQYYSNLAKADCWTVDTEIKTNDMYSVDQDKFKSQYFRFLKEVNSFGLSNELSKINFNVFLYDVCFAYILETSEGKTLFYFDPEDCVITGRVDGIPTYAIKRVSPNSKKMKSYPDEVKQLIMETPKDKTYKEYVKIPFEKSFCLKYHDIFDFIFPPFFFIIKEILDIEDFKDLEKTRVENEIYKILALKIPTTDEGKIALGDELVTPFAELANDIVADSIGILPTPFDVTPVEFTTNTSNNINNVQNAIDELYSELGVSKSILSGASSGSEVKISIEVDAAEAYRMLRQVSRLVNFHCKLRLPLNKDYDFVFRYLEVTAHNQQTKTDNLLKLAQTSCPVKIELMASTGNNPSKMFGNEFVENTVFNLVEKWQPMKTSFTQSNDDVGGRPEQDDTEISAITQTTRDNDNNDPDNRV